MKTWAVRILVFPLLLCSALPRVHVATGADYVSQLDQSFFSNGNLKAVRLPTQSGAQSFVVNKGFLEGANQTKLFGENRPTTLWGDERRVECYEMTLRIMAQLPSGTQLDAEGAQSLLRNLGLSAEVVGEIATSLDAVWYINSSGSKSSHFKELASGSWSQNGR